MQGVGLDTENVAPRLDALASPAPGEGFAERLKGVFAEADALQKSAEQEADTLAAGEGSTVDTMIALSRADLSLRFVVALRNRAATGLRRPHADAGYRFVAQLDLAQITNQIQSLSPMRRVALGVAVLGSLAFGIWLTVGTGATPYRTLYRGLDEGDASRVVDALAAERIDYRLEEGGTSVVVPASAVYEARIRLAGRGLPGGLGRRLRALRRAALRHDRLRAPRELPASAPGRARPQHRTPRLGGSRPRADRDSRALALRRRRRAHAECFGGRALARGSGAGCGPRPGHRSLGLLGRRGARAPARQRRR